jgi:hypothetical protein
MCMCALQHACTTDTDTRTLCNPLFPPYTNCIQLNINNRLSNRSQQPLEQPLKQPLNSTSRLDVEVDTEPQIAWSNAVTEAVGP